jgi:hypothetical protein
MRQPEPRQSVKAAIRPRTKIDRCADREMCSETMSGLRHFATFMALLKSCPSRNGSSRPIANKRCCSHACKRHSLVPMIAGPEGGPCGYGVHRQLTSLGHRCDVVAPAPSLPFFMGRPGWVRSSA